MRQVQRQPAVWTNPRYTEADSQALRVQPHSIKRLKAVTEAVGEKTISPTNLKVMAIIRKNHYIHFVK